MTGVKTVLDSDQIINPYSWNSALLRGGKYYSVNHYRPGKSVTTGESLPERVEIRYRITKLQDFQNHEITPVL